MPDHAEFLTDAVTIDTLYDLLQNDRLDEAVAYLKSLGDPPVVMQKWIGVQCDINNVKHDPRLSELIARPGVAFALEHGFKKGAAILLHNITAFYMPDWDEGVDPAIAPRLAETAMQQVALRRELNDPGSLGWALWDLGMCALVAGDFDGAVNAFDESASVFASNNDPDGEAWAKLFKGRAFVRLKPLFAAEGKSLMTEAGETIRKVGEEWEKEEVGRILTRSGLK